MREMAIFRRKFVDFIDGKYGKEQKENPRLAELNVADLETIINWWGEFNEPKSPDLATEAGKKKT